MNDPSAWAKWIWKEHRKSAILLGLGILLLPVSLLRSPTVRVNTKGLPEPLRPIHLVRLEMSSYLSSLDHLASQPETPLAACRSAAIRLLGLTQGDTPEFDREDNLMGLLGVPAFPAYYRVGTDTIYFWDSNSSILRHEWIHALHDQYTPRTSREARSSDEATARRMVAEGIALYEAHKSNPPVKPGPTIEENVFFLSYAMGAQYVGSHAGSDMKRAFALQPATAYEVVFGRPAAVRPIPLPEYPSGYTLRCSDQVGIAGLMTAYLQVKETVSDTEILALIASWAGDRLDLLDTPDGPVVFWRIALRDSTERMAWRKGPGSRFPLTRPATHVLLLADSAVLPVSGSPPSN